MQNRTPSHGISTTQKIIIFPQIKRGIYLGQSFIALGPTRRALNYQPSMKNFISVSAIQKIIHMYGPNCNFPNEQTFFSCVWQHCRPSCTFALIRLMTLTGRWGKLWGITGLTVKSDCRLYFHMMDGRERSEIVDRKCVAQAVYEINAVCW
jgi:hypothetical protein